MGDTVRVWLDQEEFWPEILVSEVPGPVHSFESGFDVPAALVAEFLEAKDRFMELNGQFEEMIAVREAEALARVKVEPTFADKTKAILRARKRAAQAPGDSSVEAAKEL